MAILLHPASRTDAWRSALADLLPDETILLLGEIDGNDHLDDIDIVVAWELPPAELERLHNLKAICSLGAGTEQWQHRSVPDVPVVRLADPGMSDDMAAYALHWALHFQRGFDQTRQLQQERRFEDPASGDLTDPVVGVLGFGTIGSRIGRAFTDLGCRVNAWTRSGRSGEGPVTHFHGDDQLADFLAASNTVINVLPSTPATTGLLNADRLATLPAGAVLINIGRGSAVVEQDLLDALDSGHLKAAVLDVTEPEPPRSDSPLFSHPGVTLTGHSAGTTMISTAAPLVAANIGRLRSGVAPFPLLDRTLGY